MSMGTEESTAQGLVDISNDMRRTFDNLRQKCGHVIEVVDETMQLLARSGWSRWPDDRAIQGYEDLERWSREQAELGRSVIETNEDPEKGERFPYPGQYAALLVALPSVIVGLGTASAACLHGLFTQSIGLYRSLLESLLHIDLLIQKPELGWRYLSKSRAVYQATQDAKRKWKKPEAELTPFQTLFMQISNAGLNAGSHAGFAHAVWRGAGDPAADAAPHERPLTFIDLANPRLGGYPAIYARSVLDLVSALRWSHIGMNTEVWTAGHAQIQPKVQAILDEISPRQQGEGCE